MYCFVIRQVKFFQFTCLSGTILLTITVSISNIIVCLEKKVISYSYLRHIGSTYRHLTNKCIYKFRVPARKRYIYHYHKFRTIFPKEKYDHRLQNWVFLFFGLKDYIYLNKIVLQYEVYSSVRDGSKYNLCSK